MFSTCLTAEKQGNRNIVVSPFGDYYAPTQPHTTESKVSYNMTTNPDYYTPETASKLHINLNMINDIIYITGLTPEGIPLVGGIWRIYRQQGFPVDISLMEIREKGYLPDIMELFAESTFYAELPQVRKQVPELFTLENIHKWNLYLESFGLKESNQFDVAEKILMEKRNNGIDKKDYGKMILMCLELAEIANHRKFIEAGKPTN